MFPMTGETNCKCGALAQDAGYFDISTMLSDNASGECQPQASSLFLGGKIWLENLDHIILRNPLALILDPNSTGLVLNTGGNFNMGLSFTGLNGILNQVYQHLLHLHGVRKDSF